MGWSKNKQNKDRICHYPLPDGSLTTRIVNELRCKWMVKEKAEFCLKECEHGISEAGQAVGKQKI